MSVLTELQELDLNNIGSLSRNAKLVLAGIFGVLIIFIGYYLAIKPQLESLEAAKAQEPRLKKTYLETKALAINLDAYKKQMVEANEVFDVLKKQLPNASEIPDLLTDVTQVGLSRGLQFEQIKPGKVINKDFYAEKIVNLRVNGQYHQIANFISDIAGLPRIINVDSFQLSRQTQDSDILTLKAVTKTYHYIDDGLQASSNLDSE